MKITFTSGRFSKEPWSPSENSTARQRIFSQKPTKASQAKSELNIQEAFPNPDIQERIQRLNASNDDIAKELFRWGYGKECESSFRKHITQAGQFKIERKIRSKSSLDQAFFHTPQCGLGEAIEFSEFSKKRKILALDFNSMFASIVAYENFPDPQKLQLRTSGPFLESIIDNRINQGIFFCEIEPKPEHLRKLSQFAPLFMGSEGRTTPIRLAKNQAIQAWFHAVEIKAIHPYCNITISQGIFSEKAINHPLATWVGPAFELKRHGNELQKTIAKEMLTSLHTCASRASMMTTNWKSQEEVEQEFLQRFKCQPFDHPHYGYKLSEREVNDGSFLQKWRIYKTDNNSNVYSLSSTVYACARAKLFKLLMTASSMDGARVCYYNIDSIHLSVPSDQVKATLDLIHQSHPISDQLGHLKLEAIAQAGLWLDSGLYWLFDWRDGQGNLVKHGALHKDKEKAFELKRTIEVFDEFLGFKTPTNLHLLKTMSPHKRLQGNRWIRPKAEEFHKGRAAASSQRVEESGRIINTILKARAMANAKQ